MMIEVLKSKLHCVTVTEANLNYMGSITIDEDLMDAANLIAGEKVQVVDNNNGERFETYIIGGRIKPLTEAVVGSAGIKSLEGMNFTKAFMGTNGIDSNVGFTTPDIEEARLKEAAIHNSYMTFVLADHTKFRKVCAVTFAPLRVGCIITDDCPDNKYSEITIVKEVTK